MKAVDEMAVLPRLNPILRRNFEKESSGRCGLCQNCKCGANVTPCDDCVNCGCWTTGRFGRGVFGQAMLWPFVLRDVRHEPVATVLRMDGVRLECHARRADGKALDSLKGKVVQAWAELDGVVRVEPASKRLLGKMKELTTWRFG